MTVRLVLVTDPAYTLEGVLDVITRASGVLARGTLAVQLRDKSDVARRRTWGRALAERLAPLGVPLLVNGDLELAREIGAAGSHVPDGASIEEARAAFPRGLVTSAAHETEGVRRALAAGADAVLVSPVYRSPGKGEPRGVGALADARLVAEELAKARGAPRARVFALGGVDEGNVGACASAGADGVAVIRALLNASSPANAARALVRPFEVREPPAPVREPAQSSMGPSSSPDRT